MFSLKDGFLNVERRTKGVLLGVSAMAAILVAPMSLATTVQFQTVMGNFEVNLYDKATPKTVENFLAYVQAGAYTNSVVHRAVPSFIAQGGGYQYDATISPSSGSLPLKQIVALSPVINEPVYSNKRGTIAMAKLGGQPNSATSEWFINVADNSQNLDQQNGGFTAFGEVMGNGMAVVDAIMTLKALSFGGSAMPVRDYTADNAAKGDPVTDKNLVLITNVVVLDASADTAAALQPAKNVLLGQSGSGNGSGTEVPKPGSKKSGGTADWLFMLLLVSLMRVRRCGASRC